MENNIRVHDLYFQPFLSEEEIQNRVKELGIILHQKYAGKNPVFLGVLNGAFIFAADLIRACNFDSETSFIKLSSYRGLKSSGEVSELIGLEVDVMDRPVIIVEDIIDSGKTLSNFIPELQKMGPESVEVVSLLIKPEALEHEIPAHYYIGFEIPTLFVVGYGLDYDGLGRNLPSIYQLVGE